MNSASDQLEQRIKDRSARIAVLGLGYVGLPLAVELAKVGYPVTGVDVDAGRVERLNRGESYLADVPSQALSWIVSAGRLSATTDYGWLAQADVIFICVPTPFTPSRAPDLSFIVAASQGIAARLRPGQLVILQSTTHPGTTEEEVLPLLEASGLKVGVDFHLAFSPERINPGDKLNTVANTPKVVGGVTPRCAELAAELLRSLTPKVQIVSSPRAAELCKLLENIFRAVNIALVNELALLAERMKVDFWEVIQAASTKPFGFMPFYPGPGVGGHCIPVDPYYLSWKAREYDFSTKFIELAAEVNQDMPYHVVEKVGEALNSQGKPVRGASVLVLGVAFKKDVDDARNSPAERIIELLLLRGAQVSYNDPLVPRFPLGSDALFPQGPVLESVTLHDGVLRAADCVVIVAGHSQYDYQRLVELAPLVVDTCNATAGIAAPLGRVFRLGAPSPRVSPQPP